MAAGHCGIYMEIRFFFLKKMSVRNLQSHRRKNRAGLIHKWSHKHEPGVCVQANGTLHLLLKMFSVAQAGSRLMG